MSAEIMSKKLQNQEVEIIFFIEKENIEKKVLAQVGLSILDLARQYDIDLEGACEGSLACSTCHVVLEKDFYDSLEPPKEEEDDMLDLAFNLTTTSRLGCQLTITSKWDNARITIPAETRNINL